MVVRKADDISNLDDFDENKPVAKRREFESYDLIIALGKERYEYHCYEMWMNFNSFFFLDLADTRTGLGEDLIRRIELPDISPRIWGLMMQLVELPLCEALDRVANLSDLILIIDNLHRYRFLIRFSNCGVLVPKLVSTVFKTFSKKLGSDPVFAVQRMGKLIDLALLCDRIELNGSQDAILAFFRQALALVQEAERGCGSFICKRKQLIRLVPLIAKEGLVGDRWTKEEIICPLFPDCYLAALSKASEESRLRAVQNRMSTQSGMLHMAGYPHDPLEVKSYRDLDWGDGDAVEPVAKRCRLAPHDLTIFIGKERYEYNCYGVCMAYKSDSIDDELVTTVPGANQMRTIELPDISPRIWGLMMQLDELDWSEALNRVSKISDLTLVAEKFHRYGFSHGLFVSGMLISKVFKTFTKKLGSDPLFVTQRMAKLIELALFCNRIALKGSHDAIVPFFREALRWPQEGGKRCRGVIYRRKHLRLLAPLIAKEGLVGDRWTNEEILCPLFPRVYLAELSKVNEESRHRIIRTRASKRAAKLQAQGPLPHELLEERIWFDSGGYDAVGSLALLYNTLHGFDPFDRFD